MKEKEFNLSKKSEEWFSARAELDVKEFIKRLKGKLLTKGRKPSRTFIKETIDELAGEKF